MVEVSPISPTNLREGATGSERNVLAFLRGLETDASLFQPEQMRRRLIALDALDAVFGGLECELSASGADAGELALAEVLRTRLEATNAEVYRSVRSDIVGGVQPQALLRWLRECGDASGLESPLPGLGFDYRDELVSGVLQIEEPNEPETQRSPEMVWYQPTPVRHVLQLIDAASIAEDEVFVDLGSGLGHVPLLVSLLTGARSVGVEIEAAYVASARACAESLRCSRVSFLEQDVREADLSRGTIVYLYTPFSGSMLADVLGALQRESRRRAFKVCTLGPCTRSVANEAWLRARTPPDAGHITVFDTR
jgi:hypothetical protein